MKKATARIYRFNDCVAMHLADGRTVYIPANLARDIGTALQNCADDIDKRKFTQSNIPTKEWEWITK